MSALPRLAKDAPPVTISAPIAATDIVEATERHGSVSSSYTDEDKKLNQDVSWTPASDSQAESLADDSFAPLSRKHVFQDEKVAVGGMGCG